MPFPLPAPNHALPWLLRTGALLGLLAGGTFSTPAGAQEARYREEAQTLRGNPRVQEAFRIIQELEPRTLDDLVALAQIPAPPFQEQERARAFADLLRAAGADSVKLDAVGNVLAFRGGRGRGRTVVLGGHLDTVFPEGTDVTVRTRGDTLFAPGIGDDARGLIVVLTVLRAMEAAEIRTDADLIFLGSVGEEGLGDLRGVKHFFGEGGHGVDAFIEVDGGGLSPIVSMGLGSVRYRVTFQGPGGHSWGAFGLANPVHALGRAVERFAEVAEPLTHAGPRTSFNVGRIGGGTSVNSIPFEAWMEVDMRSEGPEALGAIEAAFLGAVDQALAEENRFRREGPELEAQVERIGSRPSGETDPNAPLLHRAREVTRLFGVEPEFSRSSTNSNTPIALGIPAVTIGRGGEGGENHSPGEWWINRDGHLAIQRALLLLVAEAGLGR